MTSLMMMKTIMNDTSSLYLSLNLSVNNNNYYCSRYHFQFNRSEECFQHHAIGRVPEGESDGSGLGLLSLEVSVWPA